jgi:hypothetical protein
MNSNQFLALCRALVSFGAGSLVSYGVISQSFEHVLESAALFGISSAWSYWTHKHKIGPNMGEE